MLKIIEENNIKYLDEFPDKKDDIKVKYTEMLQSYLDKFDIEADLRFEPLTSKCIVGIVLNPKGYEHSSTYIINCNAIFKANEEIMQNAEFIAEELTEEVFNDVLEGIDKSDTSEFKEYCKNLEKELLRFAKDAKIKFSLKENKTIIEEDEKELQDYSFDNIDEIKNRGLCAKNPRWTMSGNNYNYVFGYLGKFIGTDNEEYVVIRRNLNDYRVISFDRFIKNYAFSK